MVDYDFYGFDLQKEIKNIKKYIPNSMKDILEKSKSKKLIKEEVYFIDKVEKVNKFGIGQQRYLILTDKAIYNIKTGFFTNDLTIKRRIEYINLKGLTFEPSHKRLVIHGENNEYDYYYKTPFVESVVGYISTFYELETSKPLKLVEIKKDVSLKEYVLSKEEKEKNPNSSKLNDDLVCINLLPRYFNFISTNGKKISKKSKSEKNSYYFDLAYDKFKSFLEYIKQNPSLLERLCFICLKDKDYQLNIDKDETYKINLTRNIYKKEIVEYIRKDDGNFKNLHSFIIPTECNHFYHKYCLNFAKKFGNEECLLCYYALTIRNYYLFNYPYDVYALRNIHLYLNNAGTSPFEGICHAYMKMYEFFKDNYLLYIPSFEKRDLVRNSIEIWIKCMKNSQYRYYNKNTDYRIEFDFNEKEAEKYNKEFDNCMNRYLKSFKNTNNYSDDDDDDDDDDNDEYYDRKKQKNEIIENKKEKDKIVDLFCCYDCKNYCGYCRKKLTFEENKYMKIRAHSKCVHALKSCIVCGKNYGLFTYRTVCKNCKSKFLINKCYYCKIKI